MTNLYEAALGQEEEVIELTLEEYDEAKQHHEIIIARSDAAKRLASNEDFKTLVSEGYLTEEPQRLAELMASGRLHKTTMEDCTRSLDAVGQFRNFFRTMISEGDQAREDLKSLEEERDRALEAQDKE